MSAPLTIFYNSFGSPDMYRMIRGHLRPGMSLVTLDSDDDTERRNKIAECDVAIVAAKPLTAQTIDAASRLKLVHHQGVGYHDTVDMKALSERKVPLALTPDGTSISVAEHTVMLALAAARRAAFADAELRQGRWHINALRPVSVELFGKTLGYIGFGRIGQETAKRFAAFGTRGYYFDSAAKLHDNANLAEPADFDWIVEHADILTLHLPLTDATRHLISAGVIARMKQDAILINTARGGIVDDQALVEALASGKLLAAGLDVFEGEPIGQGHPLCALPNVVLTPHISAGTRDALSQKMAALFANVARFQRGEPLKNQVSY